MDFVFQGFHQVFVKHDAIAELTQPRLIFLDRAGAQLLLNERSNFLMPLLQLPLRLIAGTGKFPQTGIAFLEGRDADQLLDLLLRRRQLLVQLLPDGVVFQLGQNRRLLDGHAIRIRSLPFLSH